MTDDLEARARELFVWHRGFRVQDGRVVEVEETNVALPKLLAWARLLVAESRAGAREVLSRIAVEANSLGDADGILDRIENWATDALAAEAEPGGAGSESGMTRALKLAELKTMHARIHDLRERKYENPLAVVYLRGAEDVIDWLMETCPDGEIVGEYDPAEAANDLGWSIALVPEADVDKIGGIRLRAVSEAEPGAQG